ncbi:uncharacterized protein [Phaseolus vulgaris]|uniref:uncharacterized protein n=1 Tax=Phaseolus vulgaris TaxID=3885 RepID=UPI0035CAA1D6
MGQVTGEYQAKDPQMVAYLSYVQVLKGVFAVFELVHVPGEQVLKGVFAVFELVHVPGEQNARADLLAKLASSGKGGRQRLVIQETLKTPRAFVADNMVGVLQVGSSRKGVRSHQSLTQETLRAPSVSAYLDSLEGENPMQVCVLEKGDTWMTPYRRYLADGILSVEPEEGKKIKKNSARYTLMDGELFRHGFTHPILMFVSAEQCTQIMSELHEGICGWESWW